MKYLMLTIAGLAFASPALAAGDAAKGAAAFMKCKACHSITKDDGTDVVKGGKVGPNLFGVVGRKAGSAAGFAYSDVMKAAGDKGLVWDEANIVAYLPDPTKFLEDKSGDATGRSKMTFKLTSGAEDIVAYLATAGK